MARKFFLILILISVISVVSTARSAEKSVLRITVSSVINPVSAEFIEKSISMANEGGYEAIIIQLDTPGGLDTSMRTIIKSINQSTVPVVVYVSPSGARAASANGCRVLNPRKSISGVATRVLSFKINAAGTARAN